MPEVAGASGSALDASVTVEQQTPDTEQTPPRSMAEGSGYDPDAPKIHRSPPKEEIYPDWKPGDPRPGYEEALAAREAELAAHAAAELEDDE